LLKDQNPSITHVAVLAACGAGPNPNNQERPCTTRGRIEGHVACNERGARLGQYRDGKTYTAGGQLFGYGDLLAALIVTMRGGARGADRRLKVADEALLVLGWQTIWLAAFPFYPDNPPACCSPFYARFS
jgi:hypothetical protein